jgi:CubicO group peptidase (beta-lactamase class C family)
MKYISTYLVILITHLFFFTAVEKEGIESSKLKKKIEKKIFKIAKSRNIPALELTITTENEVVELNYTHKEVKKQNIYGVGSTTKYLTAVAIFKLVEDQKLSLDDKVSDYIKLSRPIKGFENLSIKQLLNHTSGLTDYTKNSHWMQNLMKSNAPKTFEEKTALISNALENSGKFSYSNTNYLFLQKVVETVTGQAYHEYFNSFYAKNNLSEIKMGVDENGLQAFFGQTSQASSDVSTWREYYGFDGGAFSHTKALNSFLTKLYREKTILESSTISKMEEWIDMQPMSIVIGDGIISEYGNGIMRLSYNGEEYIGHFGSTLKYQSMAFYNHKKDISISLVTNCSGKYYNNVFFQELIPEILDEL